MTAAHEEQLYDLQASTSVYPNVLFLDMEIHFTKPSPVLGTQ